MRYAFPSWEEIYIECKKISKSIAKAYKPDVVLALSRGGLIPARIICDMLIVKDLVTIKVDHWGITAQKDGSARLRYPVDIDLKGKNVLIVDDITDTGESLSLAKEWAEKREPADLKTAVIYHINHSKILPDFFGKQIKKEDWVWVVWPWNFVEDMCNILPKMLEDGKYSFHEIKRMFEQESSPIPDSMLEEALSVLKEKSLLKQNPDGRWERL